MGHKQSKAKKEERGVQIAAGEDDVDASSKGKLKKKSQIKRKLTKAFSRKSTKPPKPERADNTYATKEVLKRTNSAGSLATPRGGAHDNPSGKPLNVTLSLHSQSITPISVSPRRKNSNAIARSETIATPYVSSPSTTTPVGSNEQAGYGNEGHVLYAPDTDADVEVVSPVEDTEESRPKVRRATTTSSFLKYETGGRAVALPKRMSRALVFHQQLATKELADRGAELQKIMEAEKPICDVFEDNPFKKGWCRLCKHPKTVHRDPYADIMDELMEDYY
jgi:hypothetical protein